VRQSRGNACAFQGFDVPLGGKSGEMTNTVILQTNPNIDIARCVVFVTCYAQGIEFRSFCFVYYNMKREELLYIETCFIFIIDCPAGVRVHAAQFAVRSLPW